jgi:hypothetical protein
VIGIAEPETLASAWIDIAKELGLPDRASDAAIRAALREADHLTDDVYDVPAALLFALGRNARCFSGFRAMSVLVVEWHAKTLGFKLEATRAELATMLGEVAVRERSHEDVRAWMGARLLPFGG